MVSKRITMAFLASLTAIALYACYFVARPFFKPIVFAVAIAMVFYPVHERIHRLVHNPNSAALLSTVLVILAIVIPAVALGVTITRELSDAYHTLGRGSGGSGDFYSLDLIQKPLRWMAQNFGFSELDLQAALRRRLEEGATYLPTLAATLLANVTSLILDAFVAFFTLFFLFRDGESIRRRAAAVLPVNTGQMERLTTGITDMVNASVYGILAIGAGQGLLTGLAFRAVGLPSPVLWGSVTAMFSLVPVIGTAAVWVPASIVLMMDGHWVKGLILLGWGIGVVHPVDNIVRPYLISGRVKLHTLLVFFALLGGVKAFGLPGLFLGPVVLSVTLALLSILAEDRQNWQGMWSEEGSSQARGEESPGPADGLAVGSQSS